MQVLYVGFGFIFYFVFGFEFFYICDCVCVLYLAHVISFLTLLRSLSYSFFFISFWSHLYRSTFYSAFILFICPPYLSLLLLLPPCLRSRPRSRLRSTCKKNVLDDEKYTYYIYTDTYIHIHKNTRAHLNALLLFSRLFPLKKQLLFINFTSVIHF